MEQASTHIATARYSKLTGFIRLTKIRLGGLVVFSAIISYLTVAETYEWQQMLGILAGGFLVTGAANGLNQVIESERDKLMDRTRERPIPLEVLSPTESLWFCILTGLGGTVILWTLANPLAGLLGFLSIVLYAGIYTPMKVVSPFSVFVGAFPGALPTLIGTVAATSGFGEITFLGALLFAIQFVWQFPHFWSLAWFNADDYAKGGFYLLPSKEGKDHFTRFQILLYSAFLLIVSIFPFIFHFTGLLSTAAVLLCGLALLLQAFNFYRLGTDDAARKLFLITLIYLPVVQVALMTKA